MRHTRLLLTLSVAPLVSACALDFPLEESGASSSTTAGPVETTADESWPAVMTTTEDPDEETTGASEGTSEAGEVVVECAPGDSQVCAYDGPPGTAGVGACTTATRDCGADGTWGPCNGQVVPRAEDCRTQVDESCDGTAGCNGELVWARAFGEKPGGEPGSVVVHGLTVDADGRAWITGQFKKSLRFGDETWESASNGAYMLAQIDGDGVPGFSFGDEQVDAFGHGRVFATDAAGIAVGAVVQDKLRIHPDSPVYASENFAASSVIGSLTKDGDYLWSRSFVPMDFGVVGISALEFDANGNLWMGGEFDTEFDVGTADEPWLLENHGSWDGFLLKMTAKGEVVWADRMGDDAHQSISSMAIDATGSVWLVGDFAGTMEFMGGTLYATPGDVDSSDMFIVKLDAGGHWQWGRRYGDDQRQRFLDIELDRDGSAIVTGEYRGTVKNLGDKTLAHAGPAAAVVAKFAAHGDVLWARDWACDDGCDAFSVAVDGAGQAVVSLSMPPAGAIAVDGQQHVNGTSDWASVVVKLDRDGDTVWTTDLFPDHAEVAVGPRGEVFVAGDFTTQASFADASVHLYAGVGDTDIYVVKLRP